MAMESADHLPIIHRNGTAKQDLLEALSDAANAIQEAKEKLAKTAPNKRDFYMNEDRFKRACGIYEIRSLWLEKIRIEVSKDMFAIIEMPD